MVRLTKRKGKRHAKKLVHKVIKLPKRPYELTRFTYRDAAYELPPLDNNNDDDIIEEQPES